VNAHEAPRSASPGQPPEAAPPSAGPPGAAAVGDGPAVEIHSADVVADIGLGRGPVGMAARLLGLTLFIVVSVSASPASQRAVAVALVAAIVGGVAFALWRRPTPVWQVLLGLAVAAAAGDTLYALQPRSIGWVATYVAVPMVLTRLSNRHAIPFVAVAVAAVGLVALLNDSPGAGIGLVAGCLGVSTIGVSIRAARERAASAEQLLASERQTREANARTHVLAERQRLAREIHDILAHTLSAQVVQLENARLLLARGADRDAVRAQIDQAQRLARDGLAETKRALHSLRGEARPLPEALGALAETAGARLRVEGSPGPVEPEASLALERTVQEALTNVRKHAPGATADVTLRFLPDGYAVEVVDTGGGAAPLADTGPGYGLTGMRERAELLGGRLEAGPDPRGTGYRVALWVPA
jgi:signal transduction histidine kinase